MLKVIEDQEVIEIQSQMPAGKRVWILLLGLVPLLAPYELIIRVDWQDYINAIFLFAALISAGAVAVTVLFWWAALAGLSSQLRFDRARGTVTYCAGAPLVRWRTTRCPLENIIELQVEEHDWSDGAPSYSFLARMADGRAFSSGSSWSREEIEDVVSRVSSHLYPSTR